MFFIVFFSKKKHSFSQIKSNSTQRLFFCSELDETDLDDDDVDKNNEDVSNSQYGYVPGSKNDNTSETNERQSREARKIRRQLRNSGMTSPNSISMSISS